MKTVDQLAQSAYQAYCKMAAQIDEEGLAGHAQAWEQLDTGTQQCWVAVVTQLWAELTALQMGVPASVATAFDVAQIYRWDGKTYKTEKANSCDKCAFYWRDGGIYDACGHPDPGLAKSVCTKGQRDKGINLHWVMT